MSTVLIGSNRVIDADVILELDGSPVLQLKDSPLRVSLRTPDNVPTLVPVHVSDNADLRNDPDVAVVHDSSSASVLFRGFPILMATKAANGVIHVRVDLRKLGLVFYDDSEGLHVGGNLLSRNVLRGVKNAVALTSGRRSSTSADS